MKKCFVIKSFLGLLVIMSDIYASDRALKDSKCGFTRLLDNKEDKSVLLYEYELPLENATSKTISEDSQYLSYRKELSERIDTDPFYLLQKLV